MTISLADLCRSAALLFVASAVTACSCPDVAYVDRFVVFFDRGPLVDEAWELTFAPDGEPPCTVELTADAATIIDEEAPGCVPYRARGLDLELAHGYGVSLRKGSDEYRPREMALTLVIDGAAVIDGVYTPDYGGETRDGNLCREQSDGEIHIDLPER